MPSVPERRGDARDLEGVVSGVASRPDRVREVFVEAHELCVRKNADYGDAVSKYGAVGVLVRIGDKLGRLVAVTRSGVTLVADESVRDTLIDMANYAALAVTLLDEHRADEARLNSAP